MKPESKIRRSSRCLARIVHRLWHLAWIIWNESEMRTAERAMDHGSCLKHAKKQLRHIEQIEATFPRTDRASENIDWTAGDYDGYVQMMKRARQLERELADEREQVAILRSDIKRLEGFAKTCRLRADEAETQRDQARQDLKQADLDTIRALGERNDARAELAAHLLNKPKPTE